MPLYAIKIHPLEFVPEFFYYLDIILDYDSAEDIFRRLAFGPVPPEIEPYIEELFMRHFAVIPITVIPYPVDICD